MDPRFDFAGLETMLRRLRIVLISQRLTGDSRNGSRLSGRIRQLLSASPGSRFVEADLGTAPAAPIGISIPRAVLVSAFPLTCG